MACFSRSVGSCQSSDSSAAPGASTVADPAATEIDGATVEPAGLIARVGRAGRNRLLTASRRDMLAPGSQGRMRANRNCVSNGNATELLGGRSDYCFNGGPRQMTVGEAGNCNRVRRRGACPIVFRLKGLAPR